MTYSRLQGKWLNWNSGPNRPVPESQSQLPCYNGKNTFHLSDGENKNTQPSITDDVEKYAVLFGVGRSQHS